MLLYKIESRFRVADKSEKSITQSVEQAQALKQSVLNKVFEVTLKQLPL